MAFVSYVRNYEDYRLYLALKDVDQGCYIDFSSTDDSQGSVSQAFYERGWSGICWNPAKFERRRDQHVTGTLADLIDQRAEWINTADIHFLAIDADMPATTLRVFFERSACRPWFVLIRSGQANIHCSLIPQVLIEAGYRQCWSDGINHFWINPAKNVLSTTCFESLTHRDPVISLELLNLRVGERTHTTLVKELTKVRKKLAEREKEIDELNLGLESSRQAYNNAMGAYHAALASANRLPMRIARIVAALPGTLLGKTRFIVISCIRRPALSLHAFFERRPILLAKLMQRLNANPALEKLARRIIGKPKPVEPVLSHNEEIDLCMSPDEVKAYQQITHS